jgi:MFS superfamily sulfate permease-like transporter
LEQNNNSKVKKSFQLKYKLTLREFGGSLGDWGTLVPFIIGYVMIVGLNPAGIFLCLGVTNIFLGLKYNIPLPVQPQKTIGSIALAQKWSPNLVISTGFGTGIVWLLLGFSKKLNKIVDKIPTIIVRGIQLGLALILGWAAILLFIQDLFLGIFSFLVILLLIKREKVPSAVILTFLGIFLTFFTGAVLLTDLIFKIPSFTFYVPTWENILIGMLVAGIGQLLLTLTNVMVATVNLAKDLFPDQDTKLDSNSLAFNMGAINLVSPFIGGMPLCHGSGGLVAQYAFGARTGGSMILEGILEVVLGLFFSEALFLIFLAFPKAILGAMLLYAALLLGKVAFTNLKVKTFPIIVISAIFCFFINITAGFIISVLLFLIFKKKLKEEIVVEKKDTKKET